MEVPDQIIDNTDLARIAAAGFGVDMDSLTQELYVEMSTTGLGGEIDLTTDSTNPVVKMPGGASFPIGKDYMFNAAGEKIMLDGVTVYAPVTGKVYFSSRAVSILQGQKHVPKQVLIQVEEEEKEEPNDDDEDEDKTTKEDLATNDCCELDCDDNNEAAIIVGVILGIVCVALAGVLLLVVTKTQATASVPDKRAEQAPQSA